jgi:hypothetical protein
MISGLLQQIKKTPIGGAIASAHRIRSRRKQALAYYQPKLEQIERWLTESRETTNFTYDITETNRRYLASMLAVVLRTDPAEIRRYFEELDTDTELKEHIRGMITAGPHSGVADPTARYGRRIGWYACARVCKPRVVVETGVDKGLGAVVLTAALRRNALEGAEGRYYGTDIDPGAGYLLAPPYSSFGGMLYGDSIESLKALSDPIDLFINDSDHSAEYEAREYEIVSEKLSSKAIILGDNSHATDCLFRFSEATGRRFLFFAEQPANHWYPGSGIGIAFRDDTTKR